MQLNLELASELPPVHCDPAQIEQVVLAMVINAIDATAAGRQSLDQRAIDATTRSC